MKAIFWLSVLSQFLETSAQAQNVIACPEQIGGVPQACVNRECGNEDPENEGHCAKEAADQSHCVCDPAATTAQPLVTSVVTAPTSSGSTSAGSATYALATLTEYKDLRESITATITVSPTQSGEPADTVAAVVFAGGVAWYLASFVGAEAAALAAPKEAPPSHRDDERCEGEKSKCEDCGATLGFCVEPNPGCACEEEEKCPEQKPSCEATECKGDEGKCTLGDLKDCECEENNECPDDMDSPFCSACGGEMVDRAQCSGDSPCCNGDETGKNKGCGCYQDDGVGIFALESPVDQTAAAAWWKNAIEQEDPICQKKDPKFSEMTAPQHVRDGDPSVEKAAKEWCASMNGKTVKDGDEVPYKFIQQDLGSFWLSSSFRKTAPGNLRCGNEAKVVGDDCFQSMMSAVERCAPHQATTHGAAIAKGCLFYNVTVDGTTDSRHPPWKGDKGKPECDPKVSNIEGTFFRGLYPQFCSQVKDGEAIKKTLTNEDFKSSSNSKRAPPPSNSQYEGYKFNFEFSGGDNCEVSCDDAFGEIRSACSGTTTLKYKGSIDAGCGTYSYSIEDPPPPPPPSPVECKPLEAAPAWGLTPECFDSDNCRYPQAGYPRSAYQAAGHQFCYGGYDWTAKRDDEWSASNYFWFDTTTIDPDTDLPTYCVGSAVGEYRQWSPESGENCKAREGGLKHSDSKIEVMVTPAKDQNGCKSLKDHKLPKDGDCTKIFDQVSEKCITGDGEDETGGLFLEDSEDGCWEWWIWGVHLS
ncbi:unnamed protein product [Periconia digitata]|uniref:Uncharacterized protein n=1 Tax=Periconia digitata TaxID=1303443 RepID=A0A9W4UW64_9PLEO|nr:unnamed protein product [Periconia digitata]